MTLDFACSTRWRLIRRCRRTISRRLSVWPVKWGQPRMKRRRLRRVIQDLMYQAVKLVRTGRRWGLRLSRRNPWSAVCRALYLRLVPQ